MPIAAGVHYFLHEGGSVLRPTLVLIHDAGGDHLSWPAEMRRLPAYRVIALDLPGHGKTAGPGRQSVQDYARDVADFIDFIGLSRAVFVGHAMGGAIALTLAIRSPRPRCRDWIDLNWSDFANSIFGYRECGQSINAPKSHYVFARNVGWFPDPTKP